MYQKVLLAGGGGGVFDAFFFKLICLTAGNSIVYCSSLLTPYHSLSTLSTLLFIKNKLNSSVKECEIVLIRHF